MTDAQPRFYRGSDVDRLLGGPDGLSADVAIVGGGQAGPATAWALERADPTLRIVLVEAKPQLANGPLADPTLQKLVEEQFLPMLPTTNLNVTITLE